jgi:hypothetical protein
MNHQWIGDADRNLYEGGWLIGEDENGDLFVPRKQADAPWRRFNERNPLHWLAYFNSRRRGIVAWLEVMPS